MRSRYLFVSLTIGLALLATFLLLVDQPVTAQDTTDMEDAATGGDLAGEGGLPGPGQTLSPAAAVAPVRQSVNPAMNAHTAPLTSSVSITYDQPMDAATVSTGTFAVHAMETGLLAQTYGVGGGTIALTPTHAFKPGELVQASASTGTLNITGTAPLAPTVW